MGIEEAVGKSKQDAMDLIDSMFPFNTRIERDTSVIHMYYIGKDVDRLVMTVHNNVVTAIEREIPIKEQ